MSRILAVAQRAAGTDFEALESALRAAVLQAGARVLEQFLETVGVGRREEPVRCTCGTTAMVSKGIRRKSILTMLGRVLFGRSLFQCPRCGRTRYPGDEELDVVDTSRSPGVRRQTARLGAKESFQEAARDMKELAGLDLSRKDAERIAESTGEAMEQWDRPQRERTRFAQAPPPETPKTIETLYIEFDGTGVPMTQAETQGRKGKQKDGSAKTREAKLGCVFTQTLLGERGRPIRDPASSTFTGAVEPAAEFGWRIYAEAVRRGLFTARRIIVLTDGAEWIKNLAAIHFPMAIHIIDLYHAREHLVALCALLFDGLPKQRDAHKDRWWEYLDAGEIEAMLEEARAFLPKDPRAGKEARTAIGYFEKNKERMRYADFKAQGLFVGSGVIEAACRSIIGERLKKSGMEWTVRGANDIIALRCMEASNRTEDFWEDRAA